MRIENLIILGISADIGMGIARKASQDGVKVIGTYRSDFTERGEIESLSGVSLVSCDFQRLDDVMNFLAFVRSRDFKWDCLFSSVGTTEPIGRFFELDFDSWEKSYSLNMLHQLRVLHGLYGLRNKLTVSSICLLAGGGTNNPFRAYSAYASAKIGLIKMCELIDDETEDLNVFILGPGFVKTKTHLETLRAGSAAEGNFERVRQFMQSEDKGTTIQEIYDCLRWCVDVGADCVGGRNISIVHDDWGTPDLQSNLLEDNDMYKLRRFGN